MIVLRKTPDPDNQHDVAEVVVTFRNDLSLDGALEQVECFLLAVGYVITPGTLNCDGAAQTNV